MNVLIVKLLLELDTKAKTATTIISDNIQLYMQQIRVAAQIFYILKQETMFDKGLYFIH